MKSLIQKILALLGILIIGIGAGVGGMILKERIFSADPTQVVQAEKKPDEIGPLIEFDEFFVNLDGGGFIKTEITVEGLNSKSEDKILAKEIFIRDRIITVLGSKGLADVRTEGREKLKLELLKEINEVCGDEVKDVLFKSFVYQV